jgi:LysM repeat protein/cell division protein FtsB
MKLAFLVAALGICLFRLPAIAQNQDTGAAAAARAESDERYQQLSADMDSLHAANQALVQRITALEEEIRQLREAQTRAASNSNVQDDIKRLADKIEEVDRKRAEDKQAIADQIKQSTSSLERTLSTASAPPPASSQVRASSAKDEAVLPGGGFVYVVQSGDYLSAIVKAYNTDFKSKGMKTITLKQVMEANPGLDWNRLRVGQKLTIPKPES